MAYKGKRRAGGSGKHSAASTAGGKHRATGVRSHKAAGGKHSGKHSAKHRRAT